MKSHEWAHRLIQLGNWLLERPEFDTPNNRENLYLGNYWEDKEKFLKMARALKPLVKEYSEGDLHIRTTEAPLELFAAIERSAVCKKVQDEKWECLPLLTAEEEAEVSQ